MNWAMLKGACYEKGYTIQTMCQKAGISSSTLYRQGKSGKLPLVNLKKIKDTLELSSEATFSIFFEKEVA